MIRLRPIGLRTAEALIDFGGRSEAAQAFAPDQLEGAVALHVMLDRDVAVSSAPKDLDR